MSDPLPILKELVAFNTVSKYLKKTKDFSILEFVQNFLEKHSFNCEIIEKDGWKQLLAALIPETDENEENIPRILFLGHLDTVPFDKSEWDNLDPLMLTIDEQQQIAFGRGAQDCKGNVAALLAAAKELHLSWKSLTNEKPFSLYLAFTTDEEIGGIKGAGYLVSLLKKRNELPTAVINIDTTFAPTIRRRGSFTVHVKAPPRWTWIKPDAIKKHFQIQETREIVGEEEGPHSAYFIAGCDKHPLIAVAKRFFNNPYTWARSIEGKFLASNIIPTSVKVEAFIGPPSSLTIFNTATTTTKEGEQKEKNTRSSRTGPKKDM